MDSDKIQIVPESSGGLGNTNSKPRQESPRKTWCFTLNNYDDEEYNSLLNFSSKSSKFYIIGKEVGDSGTPHLQGYINLSEKIRLTGLKKINNRAHWEPARGTDEENFIYCSKENNFVSSKKIIKTLTETQLFDWQINIINILKSEPDDRTIHWFWEPIGKTGKSTFTKYLCIKYNAVPVEGKKNDILFCVSEFESEIYIFDFERSMEEFISYSAIEKIKNGCFMCSKYESKPIIRNSPHVICFANFRPDESKLSADRWNIIEINNLIWSPTEINLMNS